MKKFLCVENFFILFLVVAILLEVYDTFSNDGKTTFYSNAVSPNIVFSSANDVTLPKESEIVGHMTNEERYEYYLNNTHLVAHAGGGINSKTYSNSYESLDLAYKEGIRIFEVDIMKTLDGRYVLTHDAFIITKTYEDFMNTKVYGLYTPMDLSDLVEFMRTHEYAYIIPDVKDYKDKEGLLAIYSELFLNCNGDKSVFERVIGTFKRADILEYVSSKINFDIKILYYRNTLKQEKVIDTYDKLRKYCLNNDINTVVLSYLQYTVSNSVALENKDLNVILYTIDNSSAFEQYIYRGAEAIMSNFLRPEKEEKI